MLLRVLSELGVLSGLLPRVLSVVLFLIGVALSFRNDKLFGHFHCDASVSTTTQKFPIYGDYLEPVTLKPVIRIFRVFVSAFSASSLCGISSDLVFLR